MLSGLYVFLAGRWFSLRDYRLPFRSTIACSRHKTLHGSKTLKPLFQLLGSVLFHSGSHPGSSVTRTRFAHDMPSVPAWFSAASANSVEAMATAGVPWISNHTMSCKLHDAQDPQSANPATAKSLASRISLRKSSGAGTEIKERNIAWYNAAIFNTLGNDSRLSETLNHCFS